MNRAHCLTKQRGGLPIEQRGQQHWAKNCETGRTKYFLRDGSPCDKKGEPRGGTPVKVAATPRSTNPLVAAWREFEALLDARGLSSALHYAPKTMKSFERAPKWGRTVDVMQPRDYAAFVSEVGYPNLGFSLYCDKAWSFLPPALLRSYGAQCFGPKGDEPTTKALASFFAACRDFSDLTGYAFIDGEVWSVRDGLVRKRIGTFTTWFTAELSRLTKLVSKMKPDEIEEVDPHRLAG